MVIEPVEINHLDLLGTGTVIEFAAVSVPVVIEPAVGEPVEPSKCRTVIELVEMSKYGIFC